MTTPAAACTLYKNLYKAASRQWPHVRQSSRSGVTLPWRSAAILDQWVKREARPISLRQLTVFGRTLTESRLISSANYVRTELPTRIAHRLRDLQSLPYAVIANSHMSHVYNLYYGAFDTFRRLSAIKTVEENEKYCRIIKDQLRDHMTVIPRLVMGVLEVQDLMPPEATDKLMNIMLRSRISRRVIAEQHLALTDNFTSPWRYPNAHHSEDNQNDFVGEVFLKCNAKEVVERCAQRVQLTARHVYGSDSNIPEVIVQGDLDATFPYIPSHVEYVVGELLRNSIQAVVEHHGNKGYSVPPIEVLVCETPQQVIFRFSDRGGGIAQDILPFLWSFVKGPRRERRLNAFNQVPHLSATLEELQLPDEVKAALENGLAGKKRKTFDSSLSSLSGRPPNLRLGIGLPMSRVYAEYWAGSLSLQSLEGYGVDAFLEISKLGNKNEQLTTRATMDAL